MAQNVCRSDSTLRMISVPSLSWQMVAVLVVAFAKKGRVFLTAGAAPSLPQGESSESPGADRLISRVAHDKNSKFASGSF